MNTTTDITLNLKKEGKKVSYSQLKNKIDFAFSCLHGKFGEDAFPGLFEILDIPNNCAGVLGGVLSMDKDKQRELLKAAGLNVPKYVAITIDNKQITNKVNSDIGFPCIVKPSREGSSTALARPKNAEELDKAIEMAFKFDNTVLVEEVLTGKEVTTTVIGEDPPFALLPTETPAKGEYLTAQEKFLPGDARMTTPPNLPDDVIKLIQQSCVNVFSTLSLKIFSRIDGFWTGEKFVVLEPNNPPAMTPSTALWQQVAEANMNARDFLTKIIELSLKVHKNKRGPL